MKALLLEDYGRLAYAELPTPALGADDVLIEVKACGICGSDVHGMDGSTGRRKPPIVMGHEAAGVIAAVGTGVEGWSRGDRVTFDSTVSCGACAFCLEGASNLCDRRQVLGVSCDEFRRDGAFAEYIAVPARIVYRLPDELTFAHATMVETLAVALHAIERVAPVRGQTVLVVGTGMVGLLVLQALHAHGCERVLAFDVDETRLALAAELGAEPLAVPAEEVPEQVRARTGGRGADVALEVVGSSAAVRTALRSLRKGGRLALVGNLAPEIDLPLQEVVTRELALLGSATSAGEYPHAMALIASGAVDVERLISAVVPLGEAAAWFDRLHRREAGLLKVIVEPTDPAHLAHPGAPHGVHA